MDDYTIKNLKQVENMAAKFGMPDEFEARFARKDLGCERIGLSYQKLGPDLEGGFGHTHGQDEEVYVVVAGSGARSSWATRSGRSVSGMRSTSRPRRSAPSPPDPTASSCWRSVPTPRTTPRWVRSTGDREPYL